MADDGDAHEPRIARIRGNLNDGLGPFEFMADLIARSQHGPNTSALFGVAQSPHLAFPRAARGQAAVSECAITTPTATQLLQSMQTIVDTPPLSTIETNLPFKKVQEKRLAMDVKPMSGASSPSTSSEVNDVEEKRKKGPVSRSREEDYRKKRKRKRSADSSDTDEKDTENRDWQKPCSSGLAIKVENSDDTRMTINDLFGDEKKSESSMTERMGRQQRDIEKNRKEDRRVAAPSWKKEEGESPDSGFVDEAADSDREHPAPQIDAERLFLDVTEFGSLLSPPRKPAVRLPPLVHDGRTPSLKCVIDLSLLQSSDRQRIADLLHSVEHATVPQPKTPLSPPPRPTSKCVSECASSDYDRLESPRVVLRDARPQPHVAHKLHKAKSSRSPSFRRETIKKEPRESPVQRQKDTLIECSERNSDVFSGKKEVKREIVACSSSSSSCVSPVPPLKKKDKERNKESATVSSDAESLGSSKEQKVWSKLKRKEQKEKGGERRKEKERLREERELKRLKEEKEREEKEKERIAQEERSRLKEEERLKEEKEKREEEERIRIEKEKERIREEKEKERIREEKEKERIREEKERERINEERIREEKERKLREEQEREKAREEEERVRLEKEREEQARLQQEKEKEEKEKERRREREKERLKEEREKAKLREEKEKARIEKENDRVLREEKERLREKERNRERDRSKEKATGSGNKPDKKERSSKVREEELRTKKEKRDFSAEGGSASARKEQRRVGSFECLCNKSARKKVEFERNEDRSFKSFSFYQSDFARPKKHRADGELNDKLLRVLYYFESVAYFILSAAVQLPPHCETQPCDRQYHLVRETAELLKSTTNHFLHSVPSLTPLMLHYVERVKMLSWRAQAILYFHMFSTRSTQALKNYGLLSKFDLHSAELEAAAQRGESLASGGSHGSQSARSAATPSPASSTHSANNDKSKEITVPLNFYRTQRAQLSILHNLMWGIHVWKDASTIIAKGKAEREFAGQLDATCGLLTVESNLVHLSEHLATGSTWLVADYEAELAAEQGRS